MRDAGAEDQAPTLRACAHAECDSAAMSNSVWCGEHGIRFLGDPGLLEPIRDHRGEVVGDYSGIAKPGALEAAR